MKLATISSTITIAVIVFSCQKLDMEVPIQVVNLDGSSNASYFKAQVIPKLRKRNFQVVNYDTPLKLLIEDFMIDIDYNTEVVWDDCNGGHNIFNLRDENLEGRVTLTEDGRPLQQWEIQASNYEVLREGDPFLIELFFSNDEEKNCSDYFVKSKCKMDNHLKNCARRVAVDAVKKVNKFY
ncbi:hypothetical protein [Ekhidna sp.]